MAKALEEGMKAPAFKLPSDGGGAVALSDFKGKKLVVYFYPKDDTSGCTKEAVGFTEAAASFDKAGAIILGISKDSVASHDKFKAKHKLKLMLASDIEGVVCEAFGVWREKSMYGKKYMGIERSTFLIDGKGVVQKVWRNVKVPGHVEAVLDAVKELA